MWDWEHLLHKTAWKTTEQQHGKTKMLQKCCTACRRTPGSHGAEQVGAWSSVLLIPQGIRDSQQREGALEGDPEHVILQELSA